MLKKLTAMLTAGCMMALCLTTGGAFHERTGTAPIVADANSTKGKDGFIDYSVDADGTMTLSGTGAIDDYSILEGTSAPWTRYTPTKLVIEEGITGIGNEAFMNMSSITYVSIPNSVKTIGSNAFNGCTSLQKVDLTNGITRLYTGTFDHCEALTEFTIPDTVTRIDSYAFNYCKSLQKITIPAGVTRIGQRAFNECDVLQTVTILNPSCTIYKENRTICNNMNGFNGTIIGASGSTAQNYAETYHYQFTASGDTPVTPTPSATTQSTSTTTTAATTTTASTSTSTTTSTTTTTTSTTTTTTTTTTSTTTTALTTSTTQTTATTQMTETTSDPGNQPGLAAGDANGDGTVNAKDAAEILIAAAKIGTNKPSGLSPEKETAADVDGNHAINAKDASAVLRYAAAVGTNIHEPISKYIV